MAKGSGYRSDYIKEVGSQLWQDLSDALGERVTKKNLHLVLNRLQQDKNVQHNNQSQQEFQANFDAQRSSLNLVTLSKPEFPSGPVPLASPLYINRPPLEELVCTEIMQPGCLLRIKAPRKMGKSSLLNRVIDHAKVQGYKTVYLDFQEADEAVFASIEKFLRWFCINVSRQLNLPPNLDDYWDAEMGSKVSCKIYFEGYLLQHIDCSAVVLALNEVNRIFEHPKIAQDFLPMLRFWHEQAKQDHLWQKLHLVVVHSTEIYIPLKLNQSPFNVGLTVSLPPFTLKQVQNLAQSYGIDWATDSEGAQRLAPLQEMMGGHPYLISLALYHICQEEITLEALLQKAPTPSGIYSQHIRELLTMLQADPQLMSAMQQVVTVQQSVQLDVLAAYKLESMGLVQLDGHQAKPSCELYRLFFSQQFGKQNEVHGYSQSLEEEPRESSHTTETDALSNFVNPHNFTKYLEIEWPQWQTQASILSLIVCEIDYFRFDSDTHDSQIRMESLQQIASTICDGLNGQATRMTHYEGTKFTAILPQTPGDVAVEIAENVRKKVMELAISRRLDTQPHRDTLQGTHIAHINDLGLPKDNFYPVVGRNRVAMPLERLSNAQLNGFPAPFLTVSLGVATARPNHQTSPGMLIAAAEEALSQAKRKGHNCVIFNSILCQAI
nr:AAA-like domain-containing protein [Brasilonema sp. UFV-L1]